MPHPQRTASRGIVTVAAAFLLCLFSALSSTVSASASPHKSGPFELGPADSQGGSVAVERNGDLLAVYDSSNRAIVCLLQPGARKCARITRLRPLRRDSTFGVPEVFQPAPNHVVLLQETCCDSATAGGDLLYSSADGGRSFSAPVRVGALGVSAATLIGRRIVFTAQDDRAGTQVESIGVTASGPPAAIATAREKTAFSVAIGQYKGGVLVGSTFQGSRLTTTYVEYAPKGTDFNASASYRDVATFAGEDLFAMSGDALLTIQSAHHHNAVLLRIFNGRGFGPAHVVPNTRGGGPEWFTVCTDPGGTVHVFSVRGLFRNYDMIEESTLAGRSWSRPRDLGPALRNDFFDAGLNGRGRGIVLGTEPAWAYPVP